jgi:hypothetical protein
MPGNGTFHDLPVDNLVRSRVALPVVIAHPRFISNLRSHGQVFIADHPLAGAYLIRFR